MKRTIENRRQILAKLEKRRIELEARFDRGESSENLLFWLAEIDRKILSVIMGR